MVKCEQCGKFIHHIVTNCFNRDGSDSYVEVPIEEAPENAVVFEISNDWCGYGLNEEDQRDNIKCPHCGKFPFKHQEVQSYDFVQVVMFKTSNNESGLSDEQG